MFGKHIGIDLGRSTSWSTSKDGALCWNEPSVVAIRLRDNTMVAVGHEAYDMLGRTPESIEVARPIRTG
jgi:rod shape-determining protein MreB